MSSNTAKMDDSFISDASSTVVASVASTVVRASIESHSCPTSWSEDRSFDETIYYDQGLTVRDIERRRPNEQFAYVACAEIQEYDGVKYIGRHLDCIIIGVDGIYALGESDHRIAIGVFIGPGSIYNLALPMAGDTTTYGGFRNKSKHVELLAGYHGLQRAILVARHGLSDVTQIVIKSPSQYLFYVMTYLSFRWERNGYINTMGETVNSSTLVQRMLATVRELNDMGIEVNFWRIDGIALKDAHGLAHSAMETIDCELGMD
ncbi:hypothetical protein BJ878DRAFT_547264 [Calycina marina]|uniref:RNase H type-1 domain-containing protein n=1 Tax=Calycina marina TaxID=1763456 RepID=A0A9P7ZCB2_9HELO|nr:hypothetical protein BJ878DRAFT_547264 [Calycina marina]